MLMIMGEIMMMVMMNISMFIDGDDTDVNDDDGVHDDGILIMAQVEQ